MPRDHIRDFYAKGGYIKPQTDRKGEALARVKYDLGGPVLAAANPSRTVLPLMRWTEKMWDKLPDLRKAALQKVGLHGLKEGTEAFIYGRDPSNTIDASTPGWMSKMTKGDSGSVDLPPSYMKFTKSPGSKPGVGQAWNVHNHPGVDSTAMPSSVPGDYGTWLNPSANRFFSYPEGSARPWQDMMIVAPRNDQLLQIDAPNNLWEQPAQTSGLWNRNQRLTKKFIEETQPSRWLYNQDGTGAGVTGQMNLIEEWAKAHGVGLPRMDPLHDIDPKTGERMEPVMGKQFWPVYQSLAGGRWMDRMGDLGVGTEMDAATKLPNTGVNLRDAFESYIPLAKQKFGFDVGGPVRATQKALRFLNRYADPASEVIKDWTWKPIKEAMRSLPGGVPREIPEHVLNYGDFMRRAAGKVEDEGLAPRDLLKAYTTTLSSIQRQAINRDNLPGIKLSSPDQLIRPEGAFADWLGSPAGQKYLLFGSQGEAHPEAIADAAKNMRSFGLHNKLAEDLTEAPQRILGLDTPMSDVITRAMQGASTPAEWAEVTDKLKGIDAAKKGFVGAMVGYGDRPTLDARQLGIHTYDPEALSKFGRRQRGQGGEDAVARLAARQNALNMSMPSEYEPFRQHLTHHTLWDAAKDTQTSHGDIIDMMENRSRGGRVGFDIGGNVQRGAKMAAKAGQALERMYSGSLFEKWAKDTGRTAEELVEALRTKNPNVQKDRDIQAMRGVSDRMDPNLYAGTKVDMTQPAPLMRPTISPEDMRGGYVVGGMSDLSSAGPTIRGINDIAMRKPIWMPGGSDFPVYNPDLWAGAPGALSGLTNALSSAGWKPGKNQAYFANQLMLPQAVDQTHMAMEAALSMLQQSGLSRKEAGAFNDAVRNFKISVNPTKADPRRTVEAMPDFPGINSANIDEYIANTPMARRAALLKVMDKKAMNDIGVPSSSSIRAALTDPTLVGAPQGTTGRTIGRLADDPIITDPIIPHESYSSNLGGDFLGGFGKKVPGQLLFKDWVKEKGFDPNNMSSNDMRSMIISPAVQKIDQRFLDWFMPKYEKLPDWKRGGRVGYASLGSVKKLGSAAEKALNRIRTYHGSPYLYDKIDPAKIGSGEGSAAFGHGFYSAENPLVGEEYRRITGFKGDNPGRWLINGVPDDLRAKNVIEALAKQHYGYESPATKDATREIQQLLAQGHHPDDVVHFLSNRTLMPKMDPDQTRSIIQGLPPGYSTSKPGYKYTLDINAKPDQFMDLDQMMDSPNNARILAEIERDKSGVAGALRGIADQHGFNSPFDSPDAYTGKQFHDALRHWDVQGAMPNSVYDAVGPDNEKAAVAKYLGGFDLAGTRFMDRFSRGRDLPGGEGTRNYVVFPESSNLIDIVNREKARGGRVARTAFGDNA